MISTNLSFLRKANNYTQEDIASKIGVSRQAVAKWEGGETTPDIENCVALANLYGVTLDDLVKYDPSSMGMPIPPKGKYVFGTATVGERGQIVIPKRARELFDFGPGTEVMVLGDEMQQGIALMRSDIFLDALKDFFPGGGKIK